MRTFPELALEHQLLNVKLVAHRLLAQRTERRLDLYLRRQGF